jgi:hypothetical protein
MPHSRRRAQPKGCILIYVPANSTESQGLYFRARTWQPRRFNPAQVMAAASWPYSIPQELAFALSRTDSPDLQYQTPATEIPIPLIDSAGLNGNTNTSPDDPGASDLRDDETCYSFDP